MSAISSVPPCAFCGAELVCSRCGAHFLPPEQRDDLSMGARIAYTTCSICGHDSRNDPPCAHVAPDPARRVSVFQDVTATLTPGGPPLRFHLGIHPSEISPPVKVPADHAAALDLREAIADIVEDACVAYVKDQYAGTGIFGERAADRLRELLLATRGIVLTPWIKEE